jgi:hypothetical protein
MLDDEATLIMFERMSSEVSAHLSGTASMVGGEACRRCHDTDRPKQQKRNDMTHSERNTEQIDSNTEQMQTIKHSRHAIPLQLTNE